MGLESSDNSEAYLSLTIGILSFNEENNLTATYDEVREALIDFPYRSEIILLDDGSTDGTHRISSELSAQHGTTRNISHLNNRGFGAGAKTILGESTCSHILFVPGDDSFGVDSLRSVTMKLAQADVVVGIRGAGVVKRWREMLSLAVRLSTRIWTYPNDSCVGGLNVYRRELLESCPSVEDGHISLVESCMLISMRQPSMIMVPVMQKPGSGVRSNSVKIAEVVSMLRVQRRMASARLLRRKLKNPVSRSL
jgi:hypothetical protein